MNTPIYDFLRAYSESGTVRLHMPGHKGKNCFSNFYLRNILAEREYFQKGEESNFNPQNIPTEREYFPSGEESNSNPQNISRDVKYFSGKKEGNGDPQNIPAFPGNGVSGGYSGEKGDFGRAIYRAEASGRAESRGKAKKIDSANIDAFERFSPFFGVERLDITEISGADSLYEADGIIAESETNASRLFGSAATFYSTEGSSQCIRAMLSLAVGTSTNRLILAARNVHKSFVYAAGLIGFEVEWLAPKGSVSLCDCEITPELLEERLEGMDTLPKAVYLTSPNYLGRVIDVRSIAEVCHKRGVLLLIDNAHGAYLKFLSEDIHPMTLGADACCDSAHKTLPVFTGGAYLHLGARLASEAANAKATLELFGSTSPSYLILGSLDICNRYLAERFRGELAETVERIEGIKRRLAQNGWEVESSDPLRIVLRAPDGMDGGGLAQLLRDGGIECEYADSAYVVLMATPQNAPSDFERLLTVLGENSRSYSEAEYLPIVIPPRAISIREAIFAPHELIPVSEAEGRICASPTISCPPAIPIAVSGEVINREAVELFERYGIERVDVIRKP